MLKNSDDRDESKFESEQGDSPRSWAGSPASGDQRYTDSKVPHPERVVTAHRALLRSLEPAGLPAQQGSSRLGNARAEPQSRLIRVFQHPAKSANGHFGPYRSKPVRENPENQKRCALRREIPRFYAGEFQVWVLLPKALIYTHSPSRRPARRGACEGRGGDCD